MRWSLEETRYKLLKVLFQCSHTQDALSSSSNELWQHKWNVVHQGNSLDWVPRCFIWGWSQRHPLPGMYKNSSPGKQAFSINHIVYTIYAQCTILIKEQWKCSRNPSSQIPAVGQPYKQVFLRIAVSSYYVNSLLYSNKTFWNLLFSLNKMFLRSNGMCVSVLLIALWSCLKITH